MDIKNKLVDNGDLLHYALEETNDGWWDWNVKEDTFYLSPKYWKNFGYDPTTKNHLFSEVQEICHPDDLKKVQEMLQIHFDSQGKIPYKTEVRYKHVDGYWAIVTCQGRTVEWDEEGNPVRFIGIHTDITERKRNELALKTANERFELAISGVRVGVWDWLDVNSDALVWSDRLKEILGFKPDELKVGLGTFTERLHPDDKDRVWASVEKHLQENIKYDSEFRMLCKDGSYKWLRGTGQARFDKEGRPTRMVGSVEDIQERKDVELKLKESISLLDSINKNAGLAFISVDPKGLVIAYNRAAEDLLGYKADEVVGKITPVLWHDPEEVKVRAKEFSEKLNREIKPGFETFVCNSKDGKNNQYEWTLIHKDGSRIPVLLTISQLLSPDGELIGYLGIAQDISMQKAQELEIVTQTKVAHQNAKLASIGELAAGVGHEINNPLAIIKGYVNSIRIENERSGVIKNDYLLSTMDKIDIATNRISKITSGLRSFSRMDDDELANFSPVEILQESCNLLAEIYEKEYGIDLVLKIDSDLENIIVSGHRGRLQQVLMNLLSNAKDVLEKSETKNITVSCTQTKKYLHINVQDTGSGIPDEIKERIFDPFFTTKDVNEGTGIGLSLVHRFITEMNGNICVESSKKGSLFKIELPYKVDEELKSEQKEKTNPKIKLKPDTKLRILVADDEEDLRELLTELLQYFGHEVETVNNGEMALNAYLKDPGKYDIIISDMVMPKMDGPSLLRSLRNNQSIKQPGFIFFTGGINNNFDSRDNELYGLFDAYFLKPFSSEAIKEAIDICVEKMKRD